MMTNAFPQFLFELLDRPYKACKMESPDLLPAVQCNKGCTVSETEGWTGWTGGPPVLSVISTSSRSHSTPLRRSDALSTTTDIAANYSNILKINDNKNNMQSVKISLVLDFTNNFEHKGIANNYCLISNISLILCVPKLMIRNNSYSDIKVNIMKLNEGVGVIETKMTDTNKFGAFPQWWEIQSQSISKTVDNNCDFDVFVKCILINQIVGRAPIDSIPVTKNAITVQGIKYGHPHSNSFNPNFMYRGDSLPTNKSDYAFITTTRIISNHSVFPFCESEPVSTQHLAVGQEETVIVDSDNNNTTTVKHTTFKNGDYTFAALLDMVAGAGAKLASLAARGLPSALRLAGGGESSLNTPSGWGSPPGAGNNGNSNWGGSSAAVGGAGAPGQQQWGATQRPPGVLPDGNSNKIGGNGVPGNNGIGTNVSGNGGGGGSVGGWGGSVPPPSQSSQPSAQSQPTQGGGSGGGSPGGGGGPGPAATPLPSVQPTAKAQLEQLNTMRESLFSLDGWGGQHVNQDTNWEVPTSPEPGGVKMEQPGGAPVWKPTINNEKSKLLAGTDLWEANLRNGGQPPPQPVAKTPWGHTPTSNIGGTWGEDDDTPESSNVWNGPPPPQQWGGPPQQQPPHWNAPAKKDDWGGWGEPHRPDMHRPELHRAPTQDPRDMRNIMGDMRGDPRGISGRLNGSADMWGQHQGMPHAMQPQKGMMPSNMGNGVNQWGAQGPKDMGMTKGSSGWEEPSPPAARRNMPNFDDGTSLWGQQRGGGNGGGGGGMAPWKEMSSGMGRGAMQCPPGMPPNRMPGVVPNPMKPDAMWGHPHRNGSWEDGAGHAGNWEKENWNESQMNQGGTWPGGPKSKPMGGPGGSWDSDMGDWCGGPKPPAKLLPKDMVWNSKQFRLLVDMGYKKDDVELALRSRDMNVEEAMDLLGQMRGGGGMDTWRRHEEHPGGPPFDQHQQYPVPPRPHHSFPPQQPPSVPFPQPSQGLSSITNISPALVQKILNQPTSQPPPPFNQQNNPSGGGGQPSTAQLRMLVQQIQMAVSAGYLNHQILNQPLAPQTLVLLNQLLQQIKVLQQLASQQSVMQNSLGNKGNSTAMVHISVQMTKTKQQISSLQNQISAQQAIYVKQQGGVGGSSSSSGGDFFNKQHDPLSQLQNNFSDITLNKDPPSSYGSGGGQQSRLNQWKLPSLDKEGDGSEFSRAPGTTSKPTTSPQLNPLNLQPDNTWSTGRSVSDGWPSDTSDLPDGKEAWPSSQQHSSASATYTDLVPEFEPGKPWKMKSMDDDPALTPGSVVRSPLSLAAIKEPDQLGAGKSSPTTPSERSLSSSTWSYPPPAASTPSSLGLGKAELWGNKLGGARVPPGLPGSKGPAPTSWAAPQPPRSQPYPPHQQSWPSTWLLLKNLTAQIDGSTLKTLCMQHGPLQSFHLYLNQGIALAKYSTREEANKAQTALNNCVLGNTTIFAESPAESDVNMILQHLGQGGGGGGQWRGGGASSGAPKESWAFSWAENDQRATPSSLSSFLPPDLLGGESM